MRSTENDALQGKKLCQLKDTDHGIYPMVSREADDRVIAVGDGMAQSQVGSGGLAGLMLWLHDAVSHRG